MALNATEMVVISRLLKTLKNCDSPKVLCLGYPDCFFSINVFQLLIPWADVSLIKFRSVSEEFLKANNQQGPVLEPYSIFAALGAELFTSDFVKSHNGIELDLNNPIPNHLANSFDLIIDPGTVEHCFHPGVAVANITKMLKLGGIVYHQSCITFLGHGFYSISPVFFIDFYSLNGFDVSYPLCWGQAVRTTGSIDINPDFDNIGLVNPIFRIDYRYEFSSFPSAGPLYGMYIARLARRNNEIKIPIQSRYSKSAMNLFKFCAIIDDQSFPISARSDLGGLAVHAQVVLNDVVTES